MRNPWWGETMGRLEARLGELGGRLAPEAFEAAMRRWIGPRDVDEDLLMMAVGYAVLTVEVDGESLMARYRREVPHTNRRERMVLAALEDTRVAVVEVREVELDVSITFWDAARDATVRVLEASGTHAVRPGDWLLVAYQPVEGHVEMQGVVAKLAPPSIFPALHALIEGIGRDRLADATPRDTRRAADAAVDAMYEATRLPHLVNADGHDILFCTSRYTVDDADAVQRAVAGWPDIERGEASWSVIGPDRVDAIGGPPVLASFRRVDDTLELFANSRERHDAARDRFEAAVGDAATYQGTDELPPPHFDPDGPETLVDTASMWADEVPDATRSMAVRWLDEPIPALGGATPRQAVAAGRRAEVRALLAGMQVPDDPGFAELGLEPLAG